MSGIDTDSEFTGLLSGEEENGTSNGLSLIEQFTILVIVNLEGNMSQTTPEFEIPVTAVDDSTVFVTENDGSASLSTLEFVEQVQGEEDVEIDFEDFTEEFNFFDVTLESETVVSILSNVVKDGIR